MSLAFQKIGLIAKKSDPEVANVLNTLFQYLTEHGATVLIEKETAELVNINAKTVECCEFSKKCDLAIVIGGDGTLLAAARALGNANTPLLGIHMGRLGFLADVTPSAMTRQLDEILSGQFLEEYRALLKSRVIRDGKTIFETHALNDIVVHKWASSRMVELEMFIDNAFVSTERSDGLIISTPTGSTAYALSGGGPIVHPSLNAVVLVPICPHTLSHRPIVISGDSKIELVITESNIDSTKLSCDGQSTMEIINGDKIIIEKSDQRTHLIHPKEHDHFNTLRTKLGWGTTPYR